MSDCNLIEIIDGNLCIGDTLPMINTNFSNLDTAVCVLSTSTRTTFSYLSTAVYNLSSSVITTRNIGVSSNLISLVYSLSVFDSTGTYMGYLPIYR